MTNDGELLSRYLRQSSEEAFSALVDRHLNLVYSAALRQVRSPQLAEEVSQSVFTDLARSAGRLKPDTILTGWLFQVTRRTAIDVVRRESRRQARERIAAEMAAMNTATDWTQIEPLLDEGMSALREPDRTVLLLRYFDNKSLREVGETLGISDDAAQKKVSRAVERLREFFTRRGLAVGAGSLAAVLSANAVQSAPAGLVASISGIVGTAAKTVASTAITKTIAMTTTQKVLVAAIVAACFTTPVFFQQSVQAKLETQRKRLREQTDRLSGLETRNAALSNQLASTISAAPLPPGEQAELLRLRAQASSLRKQVEAASRSGKSQSREDMLAGIAAQYGERIGLIKEMLDAKPGEKIPELQYLTDGNWRDLAWNSENDTNFAKTASMARGWAENTFVNDLLYPALQQYAKQNNNAFPTDLSQLKPYFTEAVDDATLQRWEIVPASQLAPYMTQQALGQGDDQLIAPKAPVNAELDTPTVCGLSKVTAFAGRPPNVWVRAQ